MMNLDTRALEILKQLVNKAPDMHYFKPSEVVKMLWQIYIIDYESNNNINGKVFEEIIGYILTKEKCVPFYMQAKVAYIPNVNYDFVLYDEAQGPISLSAKTSLRERWKQADLEAVALKYVHRNALSYAVTLDERETKARIRMLKDCMGLNDFILADSERFDELIDRIKSRDLSRAGKVEIITSKTIIDEDNGRKRYSV